MDLDQLKADLLHDEGFVRHCYRDSLGYETIGVGRLIDARLGGGITKEEALYLLGNDVRRTVQELYEAFPWVTGLPEPAMRALANMLFQMGLGRLRGFRKMLTALQRRDWVEAHRQALDSDWAKQTPLRAQRVAGLFLECGDALPSEDG